MICKNCSSLAVKYSPKKCLFCSIDIVIDLCKICEACSSKNNKCTICLKNLNIKKEFKKCTSCGR